MSTTPLDGLMDNVDAWRIGEVCERAAGERSGDFIDRGLILRRMLEEKGYGIVPLASHREQVNKLLDEAASVAGQG